YDSNGTVQRTELLLHISNGILGANGTLLLAICVGLACLTTAIALTTAVSDYFSKLTNNFLSYRLLVVLVCLISGYLAVHGVDTIIDFAFPFLAVIYPIAVCMAIYIVLFGKFITDKKPYIAAVSITFIISVIGLLGNLGIAEEIMTQILNAIPLNKYEIPWVLPSFIIFILFAILPKNKSTKAI
ncbi:MAG TPA: branched-chain amino acid transport system II carrier protein, partial [Flavobacteriaceae bacterium]|nr:branched-chain amino acid transport system II carrier protein [Flavobacteriaceae bacterium]